MQIFTKNGGIPLYRFKKVEVLIGDKSPEMTAIIEFPSTEIIKKMIESDDFVALSDLRSRVFSELI